VKTYKVEGIILKRSNLGEADKLLSVFTKEEGKIKVLAKSIRKITSRKAGSLELFNQVKLLLVKGKNLDIITEVTVVNDFSIWRTDLKKVGVAYYLTELVDKLTPEKQEQFMVFNILQTSFNNLSSGNATKIILEFEKKLLNELGFGLPQKFDAQKSLKNYIEEITEKRINSPKIIREIW
jgi:DNA repair protein RecO (recombination protein O)